MKKAKEKIPHNIFLKSTEHTVTSIQTPATLVKFQKWLDIHAHMYNKILRESIQQKSLRRNNFIISGNLNISDNHARNLGIQSSGFPAQPTNRNQSTTLNRNGTVRPPNAPPFPPPLMMLPLQYCIFQVCMFEDIGSNDNRDDLKPLPSSLEHVPNDLGSSRKEMET